ncbi:hypothetical protein XENTR_v10016655 [Xenopus tropicalis]|uniref:Endothelin-1 n=1 Tax=Xenopus tropicalis TaxID=8364 RepID=F7ADY2_XENTR|eukprot:XP_002932710.1 PREDICTED: endothelin-1 [Xenopus tropicalis]
MDLQIILSLLVVLVQGVSATESLSDSARLANEPLATAQQTSSRRSSGAPLRSRRVKRCSCSSLMDKECVYFCHLDIIWINTPERTVPYGLGGPRMKRALQDTDPERLSERAGRCVCAKHKDKKCMDFCQATAEPSVQPSVAKDSRQVQQATECDGLRLGQQCIQKQHHRNNKVMKRSGSIEQAIKNSFAFASLMKKPNETRETSHHWMHKNWGVWKHRKTTS